MFKRLLGLTLLCHVLTLSAEVSITGFQKSLSAIDWQAVERGDIVYQEMPPMETEPAAIAVMFATKVNGALDDVLQQLQQPEKGVITIPINTDSAASIRQSLQRFVISADDQINLKWFKNPQADGTFNVNQQELALLQQAAQQLRKDPTHLEPLNAALREFFAQRLEAYRRGGLKGILPYDIEDKQVSAGDYLAGSLQPMTFIREQETDFYQSFLDYPKGNSEAYEQQFFLVIEDDDGQSITSLRHWMVASRDNAVLIAERKFYISHSLDAMHTLIYLEQASDNSSYVLLGNTTFTQMVTGMGSFIAHKVGRAKIKKSIEPMLQHLQAAFR